MTEVLENEVLDAELQDDATIKSAMELIDRGLGDLSERSIVSTSEMADLLLDVRSLLARVDPAVSTN